jgi:hypothetical protein
MFTGIAADQPFDTNEDASAGRLVSQRINPVRVLIGLLYSHASSVARRLLLSNVDALRDLTFELRGWRFRSREGLAASERELQPSLT